MQIKLPLSSKQRLLLIFILSSCFLLGSELLEKEFHLIPCLLCQYQRACLWGASLAGGVALIFLDCNRDFPLTLSLNLIKLSLNLTKLSLCFLALFGTLHALTHMEKIPDFCVRVQTSFSSEQAYLTRLASQIPCSTNIAKLFGLPLYVFSLLWGSIGYFLTPRKKTLLKQLAILTLCLLPFQAEATPLKKCMRGECLSSAQVNILDEDRLLLFVSFSLPETTLKSFSKQLERYGGTFVLRGIPNNSFPALFKKIKNLQEKGIETPFEIDPDLFDQFVSNKVPTLVLIGKEKRDRIVGNLSIRTSLEKILDSGDNKELAKKRLKKGGSC